MLKNFMDSEGRLTAWPVKRKMRMFALHYLATRFEKGRQYTEKEVNALLLQWHTFKDPATLRRELYNERFVDRTADGTAYWLEDTLPDVEG